MPVWGMPACGVLVGCCAFGGTPLGGPIFGNPPLGAPMAAPAALFPEMPVAEPAGKPNGWGRKAAAGGRPPVVGPVGPASPGGSCSPVPRFMRAYFASCVRSESRALASSVRKGGRWVSSYGNSKVAVWPAANQRRVTYKHAPRSAFPIWQCSDGLERARPGAVPSQSPCAERITAGVRPDPV